MAVPSHGRKTGKFLNDPYIGNGRLDEVWHAWGTAGDAPGSFIGEWTKFFWNNNVPPESQQSPGCNVVLNDVDKYKLLRAGYSQLEYCTTCRRIPICAELNCPKLAVHGAHVYDDSMWTTHSPNECLIIPTCSEHNKGSNVNNENYPLQCEALIPQAYYHGAGQRPSQVALKDTRAPRRGMKVKPYTFAWNHTITKHFDNPNQAQIYGGKGN